MRRNLFKRLFVSIMCGVMLLDCMSVQTLAAVTDNEIITEDTENVTEDAIVGGINDVSECIDDTNDTDWNIENIDVDESVIEDCVSDKENNNYVIIEDINEQSELV